MRSRVNYEGQAAVELEALASAGERGSYPLPVGNEAASVVLDARELVLAVARDVADGVPPEIVSARFHDASAAGTARACLACAEANAIDTAVLSGGVFQNRLLMELTRAALEDAGLRVLVPERLPPNDGGVAYGQAAVAATQTLEEET